MKLTKHFTLEELTYSATMEQKGLSNRIEPTVFEKVLRNLVYLAQTLEKVRREAGYKPLRVNSGYRNNTCNALVGGVKNSLHKSGLACDIPKDYCSRDILAKYFHYVLDEPNWYHCELHPKSLEIDE